MGQRAATVSLLYEVVLYRTTVLGDFCTGLHGAEESEIMATGPKRGVNPRWGPELTIEDQWRRVTDLERSAGLAK